MAQAQRIVPREQPATNRELTYTPLVVPADGGPYYTETDLHRTVAEPWNALSSLAILLPAVYWALKIRRNFRRYTFLSLCLPLLFLGGLGSTIFHAFRSHRIWLLLDVTPSALLTLLLALFFWMKVLPRKWLALPLLLLLFLIRMWTWQVFPTHSAINISYALTGIAFFVPMLLWLARTQWRGIRHIGLALLFLVLSLLFRQLDEAAAPVLPMGTHFLWHIFSGLGAYYVGLYLYQSRNNEESSAASDPL
jgi:hypothetical protein